MKIERPNAVEATPDELRELEKLKTVIENAIADGKLSRQELENIRLTMSADHKVTVAELELYRKMVQEKIDKGELVYDW